jgi:hypothetical protein
MSFWKQLVVIPALTLAVGVPPAFAIDDQPQPDQEQIGREPTGSEMMVDALVARPLAVAGSLVGAVVFVFALPFTLGSHSTAASAKQMVAAPAQYAFRKPLGQMDNCQTLPESCK